MYLEHFGLDRHPFRITPDTRIFFSGGARGVILGALVYAVDSGEGIVKVTGEVGSGKTMLCRALIKRLPPNVEVIYLANPGIDDAEVLHAITHELGLPLAEHIHASDRVHAINQYLLEQYSKGKRVVLLIEEAQNMPLPTLEAIRMLANLETETEKLLQIVLFGQPELNEQLGQHAIRQLRERITHSFHLNDFDRDAVGEYIQYRLGMSGAPRPGLFQDRSVRLIARASRGLLRRVNIIADKALLAAYIDHASSVKPYHVRAAIEDYESTSGSRFALSRKRIMSVTIITAIIALALLTVHFSF